MPHSIYPQITFLCIASRFRSLDFIFEAHKAGCKIYLITDLSNREKEWPRDLLEDIFFVDEQDANWNISNLIKSVSFLARTIHFDKIIPLDDFDVEKASALREHLRIAGMGETRMRFFRDKLAMRDKSEESEIQAPEFVHILNYERIRAFTSIVAPPWILRSRFKDESIPFIKLSSQADLWQHIYDMGDTQSFYYLERFISGERFRVDSLIYDFKIRFSGVHQLMDESNIKKHHKNLISSTLPPNSETEKALLDFNRKVVQAMGLKYGVSGNEFIRSESDGQFYFIQSSAMISGFYASELIEAAYDVNLWREWAQLEIAQSQESTYKTAKQKRSQAQVYRFPTENPALLSQKLEHPAIVWRQISHHHVTVVIKVKEFDDLDKLEQELVAKVRI